MTTDEQLQKQIKQQLDNQQLIHDNIHQRLTRLEDLTFKQQGKINELYLKLEEHQKETDKTLKNIHHWARLTDKELSHIQDVKNNEK